MHTYFSTIKTVDFEEQKWIWKDSYRVFVKYCPLPDIGMAVMIVFFFCSIEYRWGRIFVHRLHINACTVTKLWFVSWYYNYNIQIEDNFINLQIGQYFSNTLYFIKSLILIKKLKKMKEGQCVRLSVRLVFFPCVTISLFYTLPLRKCFDSWWASSPTSSFASTLCTANNELPLFEPTRPHKHEWLGTRL